MVLAESSNGMFRCLMDISTSFYLPLERRTPSRSETTRPARPAEGERMIVLIESLIMALAELLDRASRLLRWLAKPAALGLLLIGLAWLAQKVGVIS